MRHLRSIPLTIGLFATSIAACGRWALDAQRVDVMDLVATLPTAERRALVPDDLAFQIGAESVGEETRRAVLARLPSRLVWRDLRFPTRAVVHAALAVKGAPGDHVVFRIGVSDGRVYDQLFDISLGPARAWHIVNVSLARYAGWQWSLFYRPDRRPWQLILSAGSAKGAATDAVALWGDLGVQTDAASARRWRQTQERGRDGVSPSTLLGPASSAPRSSRARPM